MFEGDFFFFRYIFSHVCPGGWGIWLRSMTQRWGIWTQMSNARGIARGAMLKFRIDWYMNWLMHEIAPNSRCYIPWFTTVTITYEWLKDSYLNVVTFEYFFLARWLATTKTTSRITNPKKSPNILLVPKRKQIFRNEIIKVMTMLMTITITIERFSNVSKVHLSCFSLLYPNELLCKTIYVLKCLTCALIFMQFKLIFIWKEFHDAKSNSQMAWTRIIPPY